MPAERWMRFTMGIVAVAAGAYLLFRLRFVLVTITLAAMLAYAILPVVDLADRIRIAGRALPHFAAVSLVFVVLCIGGVGVVGVVTHPMSQEVRAFLENVGPYRDRLTATLSEARASLERNMPAALRDTLDGAIDRLSVFLLDGFSHALRATTDWLSHVVEIVLIPILAFYFLTDLTALKEELVRFLPASTRGPVLVAAHSLGRILAGYVRAQLLLMALAAVIVWAGLALLHVRFALSLGILAGLTRGVPIVGPVVGAVPIVGLAGLQSPTLGVVVLVFFVVLQVVESKIILPLVTGHALALHGATVLMAILVGNALFGLVGVFLASPVAAFIKDLIALAETGFVAPGGRGAG